MAEALQSVALSELRVGATLSAPIFDQRDGVKLLGAGLAITDELLEKLRRRHIGSVLLSASDLVRMRAYCPKGSATKADDPHEYPRSDAECELTQARDADLDGTIARFDGSSSNSLPVDARRPNGRYSKQQMRDSVERHEQCVEFLEELFQRIHQSRPFEFASLEEIWRDSFVEILEDIDLFLCLGVTPDSTDYPCRHALHAAKTALAIGAMLDVGREGLRQLSLGCLVHDLGMLQLESKSFRHNRRLVPLELQRLIDHPVHTLRLLERYLDDFPIESQLVAYQLHERCNGTGYPRGHTAATIHPLAKIAAVADTFVALVADRPHRPGLQPYSAMEVLLRDVRAGLYDGEVVRALLQAVSLFPIGSFVKLSDGRVGQVLRASRDEFDRPVVEAWDEKRPYVDAAVIDLQVERELKVVRPLASVAAVRRDG